MSDLISALDAALLASGEDVILRRTVGLSNIDVACRARVDAATTEQVEAGILATDLNIIMSPTQINNAGWPGVTSPGVPPFNVDQRVPRAGSVDKVLLRGFAPRAVSFSDPKFINGELVRINLRVTG